MWNEQQQRKSIPYGHRISKSAPCSPLKPAAKKGPMRADSFHIIHKVPLGDTPYVKAKHVQLVDKDPDRAIALFWAAINANDRVDSALKDMAIVMKQQNRPEEAIEAIKSLRNRCSEQAQESLDNVLLDLYKRCGRLDDQIALLKHKLNLIHQGMAFNGKRTKTARSQGKKFQVSIEQEATRLLGNLGWAYMQQNNYIAAEAVYRKALSIEPDNNKMCNLGICLMKQGRIVEAKAMLQCVKPASADGPWGLDSHLKSYERAQEMLKELESQSAHYNLFSENPDSEASKSSSWQPQPCPGQPPNDNQNPDSESSKSCAWQPQPCPGQPPSDNQEQNKNKRSSVLDSVANGTTTFLATAGFGPLHHKPLHQKVLAVPAEAPNSQFSIFSNGYWEENAEKDAFADENVSANINGQPVQNLPPRVAGSQMQRHAEALRHKLEQVCLKENANSIPTFPPPTSNNHTDRVLNSAALPFFSKSTPSIEERMPLTVDRTNEQKTIPIMAPKHQNNNAPKVAEQPKTPNQIKPTARRSLSFESIDCGIEPHRQPAQIKSLTKCNSISLPLPDKVDPWPGNQEFEVILAALCDSDPGSHDDKVQRRLRVFQEMTLSPNPSP